VKTGELYNPQPARRLTINAHNNGGNNGQSHQRTSSENKIIEVMAVKNGDNVNTPHSASLVGAMSTMSLEENVEPSSSIQTFRVGIEQEPTVAATSST